MINIERNTEPPAMRNPLNNRIGQNGTEEKTPSEIRMIAFLEETFPLTIEDTDMLPENFETLNAVEKFVAAKLGKADSEPDRSASAELTAVS